MKRRHWIAGAAALAALAGAGALIWRGRGVTPISPDYRCRRVATPHAAPHTRLAVHHLGHSLVGRDMPAMLEQLAHAAGYAGHSHSSQLGWGASLRQHWEPDEPVPGFDTENAHPNHRPSREELAAGRIDALVLTEMVEIRDAIRYHDSARYLALWAQAARAANPDARVYLYETWHRLDDPQGWAARVAADLPRHWEGDILRAALGHEGSGDIRIIPGGQALAAVIAAAETGQIDGLSGAEDFFARTPEGTVDPIHLGDLGAYVIAATHFASLYHASPEGLPHRLLRADGSAATALPDPAAAAVQRVVWQVVSGYAGSGVSPRS